MPTPTDFPSGCRECGFAFEYLGPRLSWCTGCGTLLVHDERGELVRTQVPGQAQARMTAGDRHVDPEQRKVRVLEQVRDALSRKDDGEQRLEGRLLTEKRRVARLRRQLDDHRQCLQAAVLYLDEYLDAGASVDTAPAIEQLVQRIGTLGGPVELPHYSHAEDINRPTDPARFSVWDSTGRLWHSALTEKASRRLARELNASPDEPLVVLAAFDARDRGEDY